MSTNEHSIYAYRPSTTDRSEFDQLTTLPPANAALGAAMTPFEIHPNRIHDAYEADPDDDTEELTPSTYADVDAAAYSLLDYLESAGNTPGIEELVSCLLADDAVTISPTLRNSLATFGAVLCARLDT